MPAYFHSLAKMGVKDLQLEPVTVAEHGDAVHEIGVATHSFCLEGCFYYVRWQRVPAVADVLQLVRRDVRRGELLLEALLGEHGLEGADALGV